MFRISPTYFGILWNSDIFWVDFVLQTCHPKTIWTQRSFHLEKQVADNGRGPFLALLFFVFAELRKAEVQKTTGMLSDLRTCFEWVFGMQGLWELSEFRDVRVRIETNLFLPFRQRKAKKRRHPDACAKVGPVLFWAGDWHVSHLLEEKTIKEQPLKPSSEESDVLTGIGVGNAWGFLITLQPSQPSKCLAAKGQGGRRCTWSLALERERKKKDWEREREKKKKWERKKKLNEAHFERVGALGGSRNRQCMIDTLPS